MKSLPHSVSLLETPARIDSQKASSEEVSIYGIFCVSYINLNKLTLEHEVEANYASCIHDTHRQNVSLNSFFQNARITSHLLQSSHPKICTSNGTFYYHMILLIQMMDVSTIIQPLIYCTHARFRGSPFPNPAILHPEKTSDSIKDLYISKRNFTP